MASDCFGGGAVEDANECSNDTVSKGTRAPATVHPSDLPKYSFLGIIDPREVDAIFETRSSAER